MSCESGSIDGIGSSRSDAFARWGTLPPPSSTLATSSADEAHPHVTPSRPSRPEAHAASFTAVGVGRGTVVTGGAANPVSLVAPPRVRAGNVASPAPPPEKSQQPLSVTADRRASRKLSSFTTAMSSSGHDAPPLMESCPFPSGVDAVDSDALLARLAGKAKQAAEVALSASRAGTTTPVPTMSLSDGLEKKQSFTRLSVTEVDAGVVGVSDADGGLRAAVGKDGSSGARLAQLCKQDKAKVARLMQDLAKLRSEKDMQKTRFERLRAQNEAIVKEVSSLRVKFGESMQLLRKYQNIVKEGEIAGGRATGVDTSNGFSGETPAGSEPTAAAAVEEIRSLREALQAAEQRSEKAESEAAADRLDREKMAEKLRNMEAYNSELRRQLKLHPARTERECVPVGEGTDKNIPLVAKTSSSASIHEGCSGGSIEAGGGARRSDHERVSTEEVVGAAQTLPLAGGEGMGSDGAHRVVSAEAVSALQEQVEMLKQQLVMVGVRQLALTGLPLGPPAVWDRARDPEPFEALNPSQGGVSQAYLPTLPDGVDYRYRGHCQGTNASAPERSIERAVDGVSRAGSGIVGVRGEGDEAVMLSGRRADGLEQEQQRGSHVVKGVWGGGEKAARKKGMDDESWRREERRDDNSGSGIQRTAPSDIEEAVEGSRARFSDGLMVIEDKREVGNSGGGTVERHGLESAADRIPWGGQRSDGQIRRGSKGLGPSRVLAGVSLADEEDGSLSHGRLAAGSGSGAVRRPRTWFEAAPDRLSCEGGVEGLEWRRRSNAIVEGVDDEVRLSTDEEHDRDCRRVNVQRRRRGLASDYLIEEETMGSCQPSGSSSSGQEKLRVSWGSVSVHSGDTETDRGRFGSVNAHSGRGRDSTKFSAAGKGEGQRGSDESRTKAPTGFSRNPAMWSPLEPSRRHRDGVRRLSSPENRGTAADGIGTAAVSTRTACQLLSKERKEYSAGSGVATPMPRRERAPTARERVKPECGSYRQVAGVVGRSRGDGKRKDRTRRYHAGEGLGTSEERGFFDGDLLDLIDDIEEEDGMHGRRSERASETRPPPYRTPQTRPSTVSYPAT